jgi:hypothetical protein
MEGGRRVETGIPARLTAAQGRKFGLTVGLAFLAIAALLFWRGGTTKAAVVGSIGGALVLAGLVAPTTLGPVERAWMGLAALISKVTTPIFMGIVYFLLVTPTGYLRGLKGGSPIKRGRGASSWIPRSQDAATPKKMERQF